MARLSLVPKDREFFNLFDEAGANILRAAQLLDQLMKPWPDAGGLGRDILICEQEGDRITHDIIHRLNSTSVTPIDREDIFALASALDDVVDFTEEAADFMGLYNIEAPMEQALQLTRVLDDACRNIAQALVAAAGVPGPEPLLGRGQPARERGRPHHPGGAGLALQGRHRPDGRDPLEGHLRPARARDRRDCEKVANILEGIVVKHT